MGSKGKSGEQVMAGLTSSVAENTKDHRLQREGMGLHMLVNRFNSGVMSDFSTSFSPQSQKTS